MEQRTTFTAKEASALAHEILHSVQSVVVGKDMIILKVFLAMLAKGHVLLEDMPGVGKTTLALAFAKTLDLDYHRIQFTPDVLPSDVTGFSVYRKDSGKMEFQKGAAFCNLLLADEINRTSPKTQSALLQLMEETAVTVDGTTYRLPEPYCVLATQNPTGSVGTQMLPESQLDRFMLCLHMGYPDLESEVQIMQARSSESIRQSCAISLRFPPQRAITRWSSSASAPAARSRSVRLPAQRRSSAAEIMSRPMTSASSLPIHSRTVSCSAHAPEPKILPRSRYWMKSSAMSRFPA